MEEKLHSRLVGKLEHHEGPSSFFHKVTHSFNAYSLSPFLQGLEQLRGIQRIR